MSEGCRKTAGLLVFRRKDTSVEVLLAHMGGPFWQRKDEGAWSIPKGEFEEETPLAAAIREFQEETGLLPKGRFLELPPLKQRSGKVLYAFALEWDCDATNIKSNTFSMEWPKGSGAMQEFPEIDRAAWFSLAAARSKLVKGQVPLLDQLPQLLSGGAQETPAT